MAPFDRHGWLILLAGAALGLAGVLLAAWGNPENSGICVSCFIENSAGALGLHGNERMQYLRPELIGFLLGGTASAALFREFRSRGGSAPLPRFVSGLFLIVGCAVFIGCPIKLVLRLTAGDWTAVAGLLGLIGGVWIGLRCLAAGVHFGSGRPQSGGGGRWLPALFLLFLGLLFWQPAFLALSASGSGAQHAPVLISLGVGLGLGGLAQRSRFCITGSLRDLLLMGRRAPLAWGLAAFFVVALVANLGTGQFRSGYYGQPGSHLDALWSGVGMLLVGWVSVLIGGCPFRQLIKAGEGDADAGLAVLGMFAGGALVQAWGLAATAAGVPLFGKLAVLSGLVFVLVSCLLFRERSSS